MNVSFQWQNLDSLTLRYHCANLTGADDVPQVTRSRTVVWVAISRADPSSAVLVALWSLPNDTWSMSTTAFVFFWGLSSAPIIRTLTSRARCTVYWATTRADFFFFPSSLEKTQDWCQMIIKSKIRNSEALRVLLTGSMSVMCARVTSRTRSDREMVRRDTGLITIAHL